MYKYWSTLLTRTLPIIVTVSFLYITSLSLTVAFSHTETHHHSTPHTCPFMAHTTSWCPMVMAEHLIAWHHLTNLIIPILSLLYCILFLSHFTTHKDRVNIHLRPHPHIPPASDIYQWLLRLFSQGILHTKIP